MRSGKPRSFKIGADLARRAETVAQAIGRKSTNSVIEDCVEASLDMIESPALARTIPKFVRIASEALRAEKSPQPLVAETPTRADYGLNEASNTQRVAHLGGKIREKNGERMVKMRGLKLVCMGVAVAFLAGCVDSPKLLHGLPSRDVLRTPAAIKAASDNDLCAAYVRNSPAAVRAEIERRTLLTEAEWTDVDAFRIRIGSSKFGVLAAFGRPSHINRTIFATSVHEQWVFESLHPHYVYFEGGRVTAIQD